MIIDLQITVAQLIRNIQDQLRSRPICLNQEIKAGSETLLLDHVEITDQISLQRVPRPTQIMGYGGVPLTIAGSALEVTQQVILHFASINTLLRNGLAPTTPPSLFNVPLKVRFALSAKSVDGQAVMKFEYIPSTDADALEQLVPNSGEQINNALSRFSGSIPLNLLGLDTLVLAPLSFVNAGLTVDSSGTTVTLRLEGNTEAATATRWADFFDGVIPRNLLAGREWALFISEDLLAFTTLKLFEAAGPQGGDFHPSAPPTASWSSSGHGVQVTQSGVVPDIGPLGEDARVTVTLNLDFNLTAPDVVVLRLTLAVASTLGGISGAIMEFLGIEPDLDRVLPPVNGWTKVGDSTYERTIYPSMRSKLFGHFIIDQVVPDAKGLYLVGSIGPMWPVAAATLEVVLEPFKWQVSGSCNDGPRIANIGSLILDNAGTAPLEICEARVLFDPAGQFPLVVKKGKPFGGPVATVRVEFGALNAAYLKGDAYPCLVLVKTNGGVRAVSLGTPIAASEDEQRRLRLDQIHAVVDCKSLTDDKTDPIFWRPDPPDKETLHIWEVFMRGLRHNEEVVLTDRNGREIAIGQVRPDGVAYARAIVTPASDGRDVVIRRPRSREAIAGRDLIVDIRQVLLEAAGTVPVEEQPLEMHLGYQNGLPVMIVVGASRSLVFNLRDPAQPKRLGVFPPGRTAESLELMTTPPEGLTEFDNHQPNTITRTAPGVVVLGEVAAQWSPSDKHITIYRATQTATPSASRAANTPADTARPG